MLLLLSTLALADSLSPPDLPDWPTREDLPADCLALDLVAGQALPPGVTRTDRTATVAACSGVVVGRGAWRQAVALADYAQTTRTLYEVVVPRLVVERDAALERAAWYEERAVVEPVPWWRSPEVAAAVGLVAGVGLTVGVVYAVAPGVR